LFAGIPPIRSRIAKEGVSFILLCYGACCAMEDIPIDIGISIGDMIMINTCGVICGGMSMINIERCVCNGSTVFFGSINREAIE
jgi:hypothetical protein